MTNITRRTALVGGVGAIAIPLLPTPAQATPLWQAAPMDPIRDVERGWVYLGWLTQDRLNVAQALGALTEDGRVHARRIPGIYEHLARYPRALDSRSRMFLTYDSILDPFRNKFISSIGAGRDG